MYSRQQNAQKNGHFNSLVTDSPSTKNSENATVGSFELRMISREMIKNAKKKKEKEESKEENTVKLVIDEQKMFTCIKCSTCEFLALYYRHI